MIAFSSLQETVKLLSDVRSAERIGLTVQFPKAEFSNINTDDERVAWDEALAANWFRAVAGQLKYKLGSMLNLPLGFPHCTAPLVGTSAEGRANALAYLQDAFRAMAAARLSSAIWLASRIPPWPNQSQQTRPQIRGPIRKAIRKSTEII